MDFTSLASGVLTTALGGVVAWHASAANLRAQARRDLRSAAGDSVIPPLEELLGLVRKWDPSGDSARWHEATEKALNAIEARAHILPRSWRHLRWSVRAAIGEATGVFGFADRTPHDSRTAVPPRCPVWADNAEEYLCHALECLRAWRDEVPRSRSRLSDLLDFDAWLRQRDDARGRAWGEPGRRDFSAVS